VATPGVPSTQNLVSIQEIRDSVLILKDGSMRTIIEVSAINFELRSEDEQIAITQNFQKFINSIDFPLQINIVSRRLYIDNYLKLAAEASSQLDNELLRIQANEYMKFIKELSSLTNIMSKKFYIVVPFYIFEAPTKTGIFDSIKSIVGSSSKTQAISEEKFSLYKNQLMQRSELIFGGLIGLGLRTRLLERDEMVKIFYDFYNPVTKASEEKK
jgi:type IV secretory pathway VirB4 component